MNREGAPIKWQELNQWLSLSCYFSPLKDDIEVSCVLNAESCTPDCWFRLQTRMTKYVWTRQLKQSRGWMSSAHVNTLLAGHSWMKDASKIPVWKWLHSSKFCTQVSKTEGAGVISAAPHCVLSNAVKHQNALHDI